MKRSFNAPTVLNLELTEVCNVKCTHCYNYWRDESMGEISLDIEKFNKIIDKAVEAKVFHVILTGGEPMAKYPLLIHGLRKLAENDISFSCNSNLMLARKDRCKELAEVGLDHILTSLPSCDPQLNDLIMGKPGSFEKIIEGIKNAIEAGIRISVNMVLNEATVSTVYKTAELVSKLGCQKLFVTRTVPPSYIEDKSKMLLSPELTKKGLDEAIRARDDFGIMIGSLVSYPLCFLGDLDKYKDFFGRGCPGQSGHVASINANGNVHACTHEAVSHGNVFEKSLSDIYKSKSMSEWRNDYHYDGCKGCRYIDICESGCRMTSLGIDGKHSGRDPLYVGPDAFTKHFSIEKEMLENDLWKNEDEKIFLLPYRIRFRKETDFYLLNARWSNTMPVDNDLAEILLKLQDKQTLFSLKDVGLKYIKEIQNLYYKDFITIEDSLYRENEITEYQNKMSGLSVNLDAL
jgi:radical SAM protein with 4Fe4S-binding SPASM domain